MYDFYRFHTMKTIKYRVHSKSVDKHSLHIHSLSKRFSILS